MYYRISYLVLVRTVDRGLLERIQSWFVLIIKNISKIFYEFSNNYFTLVDTMTLFFCSMVAIFVFLTYKVGFVLLFFYCLVIAVWFM